MPSHSVKQAKVMSAIAHGWRPSGLDIPVKVAKEFHAADAGHKYGKGHDKKALRVAKRQAKKYAEGGMTDEDQAAMQPETYANPMVKKTLGDLATLPRRAIQNSQYSLDTGNYDPSVPMEAAMTMTGGAGVVPAEANTLRAGLGNKFRSYAAEQFQKPIEEIRRLKGGYETPAYRGLHLYNEDKPNPIHEYGGEYGGEHYSTDSPHLAEMYSSYRDHPHTDYHVPEGTFNEGSQVMPLYLNTKDYHQFDAKGEKWSTANPIAMREAMDLGKPGVAVHNVWDEPNSTKNLSPKTVYITFKKGASTVKSRFATKFDPTSPNILHGVGAAGIGGGAAALNEDDMKHYARGGDVDTYDPSNRGQIPRSQQIYMPEPPKTWTQPPTGMASGGTMGNFNPERASAIGLSRQGMINSSVPGRTDKLNLNVPTGSYIIPADIPGAIGQGNSLAGGAILDKMFKSGPYGMNLGKASAGSRVGMRHSSLMKQMHFAKGGQSQVEPIVAAGGEYIIHPDTVAALGHGDLNHGHNILDAFVKHIRSKHISTLKGLKPPKGSK